MKSSNLTVLDSAERTVEHSGSGRAPRPLDRSVPEQLMALVAWAGSLPPAADDRERIDRITALEAAQAALAGAQVREVSEFHDSQVELQRDQGVPARRLGCGVGAQVALAKKVSTATGQRHVAFARQLATQLPETFELLRRGQISGWVSTLVVRETGELTVEDRTRFDAELAAELPRLSPRQAEVAARSRAYAIDPASVLRRSRTARSDRRVSIRPAPDTMALLTGFAPVEQSVAAFKSLDDHAKAMKATGDRRSLDQIRCDTFIERLTGQTTATAVPVEVGLVMNLETLLGRGDTPAQLTGHGPVPAELARHLAGVCDDSPPDQASRAKVFLRRLLTDPIDGTVIAVDSRKRRFDAKLARLFRYRDQVCRFGYCDAPIRHSDHIHAHRRGGATSAANGQGLCERDNHVKEMPGWQVTRQRHPGSRRHHTLITTPTGHTYQSHPPPALGPGSRAEPRLPAPTG